MSAEDAKAALAESSADRESMALLLMNAQCKRQLHKSLIDVFKEKIAAQVCCMAVVIEMGHQKAIDGLASSLPSLQLVHRVHCNQELVA